MNGRLSDRDRRAVVIGGVSSVLIVSAVFVLGPGFDRLTEVRESVDRERALLAREEALLGEARAFPAELAMAEDMAERYRPALLAGADPLSSTRSLIADLEEKARASRVRIIGNRIAPLDRSTGLPGHVAVAIEASGDLQGVLSFLWRIERGSTLLRVEEVELRPSDEAEFSTGMLDAASPLPMWLRARVVGLPSEEDR